MKIPQILFGKAALVKARCRKTAQRIVATLDFDSLEIGSFLETSELAGLIMVEPEPIASGMEQFHCWALRKAVSEIVRPGTEYLSFSDAWMRWSLLEPWRFLGVIGNSATGALDKDRSLLRPFVEAAARFWPILEAEGKRFGPTIDEPKSIWHVMRNVKFALANLGVPSGELLNAPLEGPIAFLRSLDEGRYSK